MKDADTQTTPVTQKGLSGSAQDGKVEINRQRKGVLKLSHGKGRGGGNGSAKSAAQRRAKERV